MLIREYLYYILNCFLLRHVNFFTQNFLLYRLVVSRNYSIYSKVCYAMLFSSLIRFSFGEEIIMNFIHNILQAVSLP